MSEPAPNGDFTGQDRMPGQPGVADLQQPFGAASGQIGNASQPPRQAHPAGTNQPPATQP